MLGDVSTFVVREEAVLLRIENNEITREVEVRFFSVYFHLLLRERRFQAICRSFVVGAKNNGIAAFHVKAQDRKSTRLNSSHTVISYAVFCLKKKKKKKKYKKKQHKKNMR